jgi:diguanylate cyclase (GGDEF)-like protein
MGLTQKILLFTSLLVVALVATTVAYTSIEANRLAHQNVDRALLEGKAFWDGFQQDRYAKLKLGLGVLANDPAFKAAVQTHDPATIKDILQERGRDLGADFFIATDPAGRVVGRSDEGWNEGEDLGKDPVVRGPLDGDSSSSTLWRRGKTLFQAVSMPMQIGETAVGVLVAGYRISEGLANQIQRLTQSEVAFLSRDGARPLELSVASQGVEAPALRALLEARRLPSSGSPFELDLDGDRHVAIDIPLKAATGEDMGSMLIMKSLATERAAFDRFRSSLVFTSLVVMAAGLVVAYWGAARITGPLSLLVALVERVREGSYAGAVTITSSDEIGTLATAFDRMREGIADREEKIRRMALQDPLTGLPNRSLFVDRVEHALGLLERGSDELAVVTLDIDRFKDVNETLGHVLGDRVLQDVASRLQNALRSSDTVARFGADEFGVLLSGAGGEEALRVCRKILGTFEVPLVIEGQRLHLAASVGVAMGGSHGRDAESLIRNAGKAMAVAKRNNAGFALYDPSYDTRESRLWLIEELRNALERRELCVHFQPKAALKTGSVSQVEALVRWIHPERGTIPPDQFIPLAEQTGLVRSVTRYVLEESIRQAGAWQSRGLPLEVAVNISARDLWDAELPGEITRMVQAAAVEPQRVRLEITESAIMEDPERALDILKNSTDLGFRLSIDDFGTGYSSLAYLRKLPVDELKIDRSFVKGMVADRGDSAIVQSTIDLGHNMGLEVVAEGVESGTVWEALKGAGCDLAQGYFLSKPLPPNDLERWLRERRHKEGVRGIGD